MSSLTIDGELPEWHSSVRTGLLDGERVAVLVGPEVLASGEVVALPPRAPTAEGPPSTLAPIAKLAVDGRWVSVYPLVSALGVVHLTRADDLCPIRAAAEIVGRVADIVASLGAAGAWPAGPAPADVLLDSRGEVTLILGAATRSEAREAPEGGDGPRAATWRLGLLLAELLLGAAPPPAADEASHDHNTRRMLIRVLSRPGPLFPEEYRALMLRLLSYRAESRPDPSEVRGLLEQVAALVTEADLVSWAARDVDRRLGAVRRPPPKALRSPIPSSEWSLGPDSTQELVGARRPDIDLTPDEKTAESVEGAPPIPQHVPAERGAMPISVGPPPEIARSRPSLPNSFFDDDEDGDAFEHTETQRNPALDGPNFPAPNMRFVVGATGVLIVLAVLLASYLYL